jgi:probable HAF family extracellular repeat protein
MKRRYIGITLCLAIALCFTLQYGCVYALTNSAMPAVRGYSITNIGTLGGNYSKAKDINSFGHIVGESTTSDGDIHAFIYIDGTMTDLGTLGGSFSSATGINDKGEVTGVSALETGDLHAFLYRDGVMNDLGTIEDSAESISTAKDINNRGEIGGESNGKAFLYKGSSLMDLSPLGIKYVSGLNNNGQIVGMLFNDRAFLYSGGRVTDLKTLSGGVNSVDRLWVLH